LTSDQLVRFCLHPCFPPRISYVNISLIRNHLTCNLAQILSRFPCQQLV
jgi:hypothetical protein